MINKKLQITIIILTNRFDDRFQKAFDSAQFAQDIIVIDNTPQVESKILLKNLQKKYQFKIINHPGKISNFSTVKNSVLDKVNTDWVFYLDSDEIIPKNAKTEIENIISTNLYDAVYIKRVDIFLNKKLNFGETGSIFLIKMFKKNKAKFVRNVHEIVQTTGKIGTSSFEIIHYSHTSIKNFLEKISFYSELDSKNKKSTSKQNLFEIFIFPPAKFLMNYIFKLGFLDGFRGLIYAIIMSLHSFFVRVYYYEKNTH